MHTLFSVECRAAFAIGASVASAGHVLVSLTVVLCDAASSILLSTADTLVHKHCMPI